MSKKLNRELIRLLKFIIDIPIIIFELFLSTIYVDHILQFRKRVWEGVHQLNPKVTIFAIFPIDGLKDSHISSLKNINKSGYSALVISNTKLTLEDRQKLLKNCWVLIERPNFGYDFGSYREGILFLRTSLKSLKYLGLLNDSSWFPVPSNTKWLLKAESKQNDFVSSTCLNLHTRGRFRRIWNNYWGIHEEVQYYTCYSGYSLLIKPNVFNNPQFYNFWKNLKLTNNYRRTSKRGERDLSKWIINSGFSNSATEEINCTTFNLKNLSAEELLRHVKYTIIISNLGKAEERKFLICNYQNNEIWKERALVYLDSMFKYEDHAYSLPSFICQKNSSGFLKKRLLRDNLMARQILIDFVKDINNQCDFNLYKEAKNIELRAKRYW